MCKKPTSTNSHPGNKFGTKLKDPDVRQEAFRQYCDHLAAGYPKEAFFFEHPELSVCWKTMDRYIAESPAEFPPILIEKAKAARYKHWLNKGGSLMEGQFKGGSPTIWTVCMRNIFKDVGWDKEQISQDNKSHVQRLANAIRSEVEPEAEEGDSGIEFED